MSADRFKKEMDQEFHQLVDNISDAIRRTGVYGWNAVTVATPVLTGRARASWLLNVDVAKDDTQPSTKAKTRVYADPVEPTVTFNVLTNQAIIISNNVEYIEYLEHGTDTNPMFAMVASTTPKINKELQRRINKIP